MCKQRASNKARVKTALALRGGCKAGRRPDARLRGTAQPADYRASRFPLFLTTKALWRVEKVSRVADVQALANSNFWLHEVFIRENCSVLYRCLF